MLSRLSLSLSFSLPHKNQTLFPSTSTTTMEIPDCHYPKEPTFIKPKLPTKNHTLHLSNLDDQKFLRFTIRYLYLYRKAPASVETLKDSLSRVLVDYYPFAGRVREVGERLELDCNGEGALFAEAEVDITADEFLQGVERPNRSWRKLLFRVADSPHGAPPLVIQVTHLSCGGMILCTAMNHCLCDGVGSVQFLHSWAHLAACRSSDSSAVVPHHSRCLTPLTPREPLLPNSALRMYTLSNPSSSNFDITFSLLSQPLSPVSVTFSPSDILELKRRCIPSVKCTSFEVLAAHVWRNWVRVLDIPDSLRVKLLFSVNVRGRVAPELPKGFYGNGFVLGCAETNVGHLVDNNIGVGVRLVKEAKEEVGDEYVRATVDHLEGERSTRPDLTASLVISPWTRLGLEEGMEFGGGEGPLYVGPVASEIYCLFLPVVGDVHAFRVLISMPERVKEEFEKGLRDVRGAEKREAVDGGKKEDVEV